MMMLRKFLTYDGEITAEEEWNVKPTDKCFYCADPLIIAHGVPCPVGFYGEHDFITLIHRG
jgi:hypothetical protein